MSTEWDGTPWEGVIAQLPKETPNGAITRIRRAQKSSMRTLDSFTTYPGWTEQMLAVQGLQDRPWRYPAVREALGVPAIFRAVSLIANTTGSLAMECFRDE